MVISENIYAMLITHARFADFTPKAIADSHASTEVLVALSCDSKEEVVGSQAAMAAGATEAKAPQDYGYMTIRSFNDLDGHIWEYMWMDPAHAQG